MSWFVLTSECGFLLCCCSEQCFAELDQQFKGDHPEAGGTRLKRFEQCMWQRRLSVLLGEFSKLTLLLMLSLLNFYHKMTRDLNNPLFCLVVSLPHGKRTINDDDDDDDWSREISLA